MFEARAGGVHEEAALRLRRTFVQLAGARDEGAENLAELVMTHRQRFVVPLAQPLVLVTGVSFAGGELLMQLLDGHSRLHVHPAEFVPGGYAGEWPAFKRSASPATLFGHLREPSVRAWARSGYPTASPVEADGSEEPESVLPFVFLEPLQERVFALMLERKQRRSRRDVLDAYATSYFNGWLDYAGLYRPVSDYWVAFMSRLLASARNARLFFGDYRDGRIVVPVRDPVELFAAAFPGGECPDLDETLDGWLDLHEGALATDEAFPEQVVFVRYEDLARPAPALKALLDRLGLPLEEANLRPTFNGIPVDGGDVRVATPPPPKVAAAIRGRLGPVHAELAERTERPVAGLARRLTRRGRRAIRPGAQPERRRSTSVRPSTARRDGAGGRGQRFTQHDLEGCYDGWTRIGRLQLEFLKDEGLQPGHRLLDVACGSFRGGRFLIDYLDEGRYFGIDASPTKLEAGIALVLDPAGLMAKRPTVRAVQLTEDGVDLAEALGASGFDYVWMHALFDHLPHRVIEASLRDTARVTAPGGRIYATFFHNPHGSDWAEPIAWGTGHVVSYRDRDPWHHSPEFFEEAVRRISGLRLDAVLDHYPHPLGLEMLRFERTA